jgi:hypothetical protein
MSSCELLGPHTPVMMTPQEVIRELWGAAIGNEGSLISNKKRERVFSGHSQGSGFPEADEFQFAS